MFPWRPLRPVVQLGMLLVMLFMGRELSWSMPRVSDYVIRVWHEEAGLPQDSVTSVLQTRDGYIWIGTYSALARFDGVRFTIYDTSNTPGMHCCRVTSLFEARDGTLWIGLEDGTVIRYQAGKFEPVNFENQGNCKGIFHIGADDAGEIWVAGRDCQFTRLRDGRTYPPPAESPWYQMSVASTYDGLWVAGSNVVSAFKNGELTRMHLGSQPLENIQGICPGRAGGFWAASDGSLQEWKGTECVKDLGAMPWGLDQLTTMFETRSGLVVAGTFDQGLYVISSRGKALHLSQTNGLPNDWVTAVTEDHEDNLWVGTRAGLVMLHPTSITTLVPPDKCAGYPVFSVALGAEGEIWLGTEGAGIYRLKKGEWSHYGVEQGLANTYVWSVSADADGRIWAGTWEKGIFVRQGDVFGRLPGLETNASAFAVLHETNGDSWVGTSSGLLRYHSGQVEWVTPEKQMKSPNVRCVVRDGAGTLWFGMFGGGLGRLKDGKLQQFRTADGLPSDFIECLKPEADGSLWIGTFGGGLARLKKGHFAVVGRDQELPGNNIEHIEDDGRGFFWISSNKGILRVNQAELSACADDLSRELHYWLFSVDDGVPTMAHSSGLQPAGCKTPDGRLLFPSSGGLVVIDPGCIQTNLLPPPVHIEKVLVDDHALEQKLVSASSVPIPPGRHRLEIGYTALSYSAPDLVLFKYRLDGMDKDWVSAGTRRTTHYGYLPPGRYTFHVIACNNDRVWNETGAQVSFVIQPYFWQTLWFRILAGATALCAVAGIAWLNAQRRLRRKFERIEQQRVIEQERARIAHDIHDDLGAYLTRITMLCDPARSGSGNGQQAAASLQRIRATATELTEAMAETVWAVNPHHDTLDSLMNYLQKFAQEFLGHAGIRCRLEVPFQLPAWSLSADMRHNLFLAFKETLNNIVKHAGATEVHIDLTLEEAGFVLIIRDNGRGVANGNPPGGAGKDTTGCNSGNGLKNIKRRIEKIGGACEIRTVPPRGTSAEFKVPVRMK